MSGPGELAWPFSLASAVLRNLWGQMACMSGRHCPTNTPCSSPSSAPVLPSHLRVPPLFGPCRILSGTLAEAVCSKDHVGWESSGRWSTPGRWKGCRPFQTCPGWERILSVSLGLAWEAVGSPTVLMHPSAHAIRSPCCQLASAGTHWHGTRAGLLPCSAQQPSYSPPCP